MTPNTISNGHLLCFPEALLSMFTFDYFLPQEVIFIGYLHSHFMRRLWFCFLKFSIPRFPFLVFCLTRWKPPLSLLSCHKKFLSEGVVIVMVSKWSFWKFFYGVVSCGGLWFKGGGVLRKRRSSFVTILINGLVKIWSLLFPFWVNRNLPKKIFSA